MKRSQRGITLISLVVTIIVLIILAGVAIFAILGDNGILAQAQKAKSETENASREEVNMLDGTNIDLAMNGVALKYDVIQKDRYAILRLYPKVNGSNTYGDYVANKVYGMSEEEKCQMFLEANNYFITQGCYDEVECETIEELVAYWASSYSDAEGCQTIDDIVKAYGFNNITELMISWYYAEPWILEENRFYSGKNFSIKMGETVITDNYSTSCPYVEIPITASGTYDITLISEGLGKTTISANVNVESSESVFVAENGVLLGLREEYMNIVEPDCSIAATSIFPIITIPSKVGNQEITVIDDNTFAAYDNITKIILPDTITRIGDSAFVGCKNLVEINIPDNVTYIGDSAFYGIKIKTINIPDSVTYLGESVFAECKDLTSVKLSKNLQSINTRTFYSCVKLTSIEIPENVTEIGECAFKFCDKLSNVKFNEKLITIKKEAFSSCKLNEINFPDTLTTIEYRAFSGNNSLTEIYIPKTVVNIDGFAFFQELIQYKLIINCEVESQPVGYVTNWDNTALTVNWGVTR